MAEQIEAHPLEVSEELEVILSQRTEECYGCRWHPNVCQYCCCSLLNENYEKNND